MLLPTTAVRPLSFPTVPSSGLNLHHAVRTCTSSCEPAPRRPNPRCVARTCASSASTAEHRAPEHRPCRSTDHAGARHRVVSPTVRPCHPPFDRVTVRLRRTSDPARWSTGHRPQTPRQQAAEGRAAAWESTGCPQLIARSAQQVNPSVDNMHRCRSGASENHSETVWTSVQLDGRNLGPQRYPQGGARVTYGGGATSRAGLRGRPASRAAPGACPSPSCRAPRRSRP